MKFRDIYNAMIKTGIRNDPRGSRFVEDELKRRKKEFDKLSADDQKKFDMETLVNPYADSRMLYGNSEKEVNTIMVGVDIEVGEILLADRLMERGKGIDLVIAHHPEGTAQAKLHEVMFMQAEIMSQYGVPINVAEGIMTDRIKEVERRLMPLNHFRTVDAARLLDIPMMCAHTPADNCVASFLQKYLEGKRPKYLSDVVDALNGLPEYETCTRQKVGPKILLGSANRRAGKIFVDMTGGTGGSKDMFEKLEFSGVGTVVGMHIGDDHRKEAEKHNINVVIAGHMGSDSVGLNLLIDEISKAGSLETVACSGFIRASRLKRGR